MAKGEGGASPQACHAEEGEGERALAQRRAARDGRQRPLAIGRGRHHATRTGEPGGGGGTGRWAMATVPGGCAGGQAGPGGTMSGSNKFQIIQI
jgi:hypothetical protein